MYYKLRQACVRSWGGFVLLQIRANIVTNWGKGCYKLGQVLQISATVIRKYGSYYKLEQDLLRIGAGITNWDNYYKLAHNNKKILSVYFLNATLDIHNYVLMKL